MDYSAKIILDSISPIGNRLTTMECCYPRMIHSEMMTHRSFSRNAASSRAIPIAKIIDQVRTNPAYPVFWGKNQSGMAAREELTGEALENAKLAWNMARENAIDAAAWMSMANTNLHKQLVNRILEPFSWITVIISATEWDNFFNLRCHADAQPEIAHIANLMKSARDESHPKLVEFGEWHMPYITEYERESVFSLCNMATTHARHGAFMRLARISVAKCARVSYLTHDGTRDLVLDYDMSRRLQNAGHWSPFEHVARPSSSAVGIVYPSNFRGWDQFRHLPEVHI